MNKVLVIEDDLTLQKVYQEVLQKEGFEVTVAANGPDGLLAIGKDHVDIVLLDIMLPGGMNGFEVLTKLKRDDVLKSTPVIIMSNLDSEKQTGMELGATDYIFKPEFNIAEIAEKIRKYLPNSQTLSS